jgi:hypothetical protein
MLRELRLCAKLLEEAAVVLDDFQAAALLKSRAESVRATISAVTAKVTA